jgi:hypothetical protein
VAGGVVHAGPLERERVLEIAHRAVEPADQLAAARACAGSGIGAA